MGKKRRDKARERQAKIDTTLAECLELIEAQCPNWRQIHARRIGRMDRDDPYRVRFMNDLRSGVPVISREAFDAEVNAS